MRFDGFPREGLSFLEQLGKNNKREWFEKHKADFKSYLEAPAKIFSEDMAKRLSKLVKLDIKSKIFRIYRDVRFSKDKTPYNTHIRILFFQDDKACTSCSANPSFFFSLEADKVISGIGNMEFSKEVLISYRQSVADGMQVKALEKVLGKFDEKDGFYMHDPELKRVPKEYESEHPRGDLLRRKGLVLWHESKPDKMVSKPEFSIQILDKYKEMKPLYNWLSKL